MHVGYVYILVNTSMPGLVKVGKTRGTASERARGLYTTGVPEPFEVAFELISEEYERLESEIHSALVECRVNPHREFFKCSVDKAIEVLKDLHAKHQAPEESLFYTLHRELKDSHTKNAAVLRLFSHLTTHQDSLDEMLPLLVYVVESQDWHDKDYAKEEAIEWLKKTQDPIAIQALCRYEKRDPQHIAL
ncbi:GIY-YIG nuclease family protein, partial [Candidatus Poribacteria bacterium]|nr:GIY-YIG nuclease family protein [Candidatus Poribacteria bacterium]